VIVEIGKLYKINEQISLWKESGKYTTPFPQKLNIGDVVLVLETKDITWEKFNNIKEHKSKEYRVLLSNGLIGWVVDSGIFENISIKKRSFKIIKKITHE